MNNETWQRRKYTATKPNWIVRGIYNTVDWFGDFNDLMRSAGGRVGRSILFVIDITILLCLFAFSAIHSFTMLDTFGVTGITQWLAIIFFEVNFLYSSIALDIANKRGERAGHRRAIFYICLAFVEASNVTALWGSIGGVVIGGVMPVMLLLSKGTFKDRKTATQSIEEKSPVQVDEITTENTKEKPDEIIEENQPSNLLEPTTLEEGNIPEQALEISTKKPPIESVGEINDMEKNVTTVEPAENKDESVAEEVAKKPTKTAVKKKPTKKKKTTIKVDDLTIEKIARDLEKEHGELPGRKLLAQVAKCTEYKARIILSKMEPSPPETEPKKLSLVK